ncbi:DUF4007 family protein [Barnesiella intestinihominis]|uniref:DUF4007 family protein n=1 Tax=Barnesiella intestinihominis TaxID=487174 RepID=UPI003AAC1BED
MTRPLFSGHETFACKSHWMKRGYEFVLEGHNFNDDEAVVHLGVGKNMVASIKFWMKAFGLLNRDGILSSIAHKLLNTDRGYDPFFEDIGSLWLMHFNIVNENYATAYRTTFIDYHSQRNVIDKLKLQNFIKHLCFDNPNYRSLYNENTVRKDLNVLIHNYCAKWNSGVEDSNTIFAPLNLIRETEDGTYMFNYDSRNIVPANIFLYALLAVFPDSKSISFESMRELSLIFCLMNNDLLTIIKQLSEEYVGILVFSDVAGIKELQIKGEISTDKALENYYIG